MKKITFDKLFTSNAPIEEILRKSSYYSLVQRNLQNNLSGDMVVSNYGDVEDDGDGYLNFIFRVSDGVKKIIVKQGRTTGRIEGFTNLSTERTRLEYESMKIREAIVPEYIPKIYLYDEDNQIFITEDVSLL